MVEEEKFTFDYGDDPIAIPQLSAFLTDIWSVCERHGIGFGGGYIVLTPWDKRSDIGILTDNLNESDVPFIQEARERVRRLRNERYERARAEESRRAKELQAAREAEMKEKGILLSDGAYKLVKIG